MLAIQRWRTEDFMSRLRLLFILALAFTALTMTAQTSFVIESIDVNPGARIPPGIVRAECRLKAGHTYTTAQLDQALYRIRRLPFVTDAEYTLTEGSSPSSRVIVFNITDEKPLNHNVSVDVIGIHHSGGVSSVDTLAYSLFTGPTGRLDMAVGGTVSGPSGSFQGLNLRYSAYGLFGTGAYAIAAISSRAGLNPSLIIGVPIGLTSTIRGSYQKSSKKADSSSYGSLDWVSDRTDDLYFPRKGMLVSVGPEWSKQRIVNDFNVGTRFYFHNDDTIARKGLAALATPFQPLPHHFALWERASASRFDESGLHNGTKGPKIKETNGAFLIGLAHNFGDGSDDVDRTRFRLEGGVGYRIEDREFSNGHQEKHHGIDVEIGTSYRTRWGIIHFSLDYTAD
jgi:hypothetical protein